MVDIQAIKTNKGYYISKAAPIHQSWNDYSLEKFLFDSAKPEPSFHKDWGLIKDAPTKVSHMEVQPNINHRFVLTDDSLASDKIPLEIKQEDVGTKKDCEGHIIWKPELAMYRSLYVLVSDEQPPKEVTDEFTFTILFEVGEILPPPLFQYPTQKKYNSYSNKMDTPTISNAQIQHQELDRIIFPNLLIHETPCRLSSEDTYKIVREYVNTHINPAVAVVTSNYDFCFEVAKRIPLAKPYNAKYEHTPRGRRKPIVETRLIKDRQVKFFEMTYSPYNYQKYTPIQGFEGTSEQDLKQQIDTYLEELITAINEPVTECPNCNGQGVIINNQLSHPK